MAIKTSATGGGVLSIHDVTGGDYTAGRGLPPRGTAISHGTLSIYNPHAPTSLLPYPVSTKFSRHGIAIIQFLYDASAIPHTVSGPRGVLSTPCKYSIKAVPGHNVSDARALLLNFSIVTNFASASPHFSTPSVPVSGIQEIIDEATTMASRLAAIVNPMSRPCMAGLIIL